MRPFLSVYPLVLLATGALAGYGAPSKDDYEEGYSGAIVNNQQSQPGLSNRDSPVVPVFGGQTTTPSTVNFIPPTRAVPSYTPMAVTPSYNGAVRPEGYGRPQPSARYSNGRPVGYSQPTTYSQPAIYNRPTSYTPPTSYSQPAAYNQASQPSYSQTSQPSYNQASQPSYNQASQPNYNQYSQPAAYTGRSSSYSNDVEPDTEIRMPYGFTYTIDDNDGTHSHNAHADSDGRVRGEYTIKLLDGRNRVVKYTADERGYRADIVTNELGTESKNPADVTIHSSAITGRDAAVQYGSRYSQRQISAPQRAAPGYAPARLQLSSRQRINPSSYSGVSQPTVLIQPVVAGQPAVTGISSNLPVADHNARYVDTVPADDATSQINGRASVRRNKPSYG